MGRLKYIDSVETDTHVYIATERVRPLNEVLRDWDTGSFVSKGGGKGKEKAKEEWLAWGVKSLGVSRGLVLLLLVRKVEWILISPIGVPYRPRSGS